MLASPAVTETAAAVERSDFIRDIVGRGPADRRRIASVVTRFPPEPNGYLHIGHAKSICLNFGIAAGVRRPLPPPLRRHQPDEGGAGVHRRHRGATCAGSASTGASTCTTPRTTSSSSTTGRSQLIRAGLAYVDDLSADEIREYRGTLTEPGRPAPGATARWRRTWTCSRACARASSPTGRACCARASTWPRGNINLRDPVLYRILHAHAPAHGRRLVHLPDVRLRARPVRRHRGHHALDLHARVREPSAALRLVHRQPARAVAAAPVRVRAPQPDATRCSRSASCCGSSRRAASAAGTTRACPRSSGLRRRGYPAEAIREFAADDRRRASATRVVDIGSARARRARRPQPHAPRAASRCCGRSRSSSRTTPRARSRCSTPSTTPRTRRPARARCRSRASSGSSATTSWRTRRRSSSASRPAARCASATRTSSPAARSSRTPPARSWSCAARTTPPRAAAMRPTVAARRRRCTGSRPRTPSLPRCASTSHLFARPDPGADGDLMADLDPRLGGGARRAAGSSRPRPTRAVGEAVQFERLGYFCARPRLAPGASGLRPHGRAQGHLGEGQARTA